MQRFLKIIDKLPAGDKKELVRLSIKYSPSTRALLGAILSQINKESITETLKESLNPITMYQITGASKVLSKSNDWNII